MPKHDHNHLVQLALQWLRGTRKCEVYVGEPRRWNSVQSPDAMGWKGTGWSIAVECKVSRSDMLKQRKKLYRKMQQLPVGQERWLLVPIGMRLTKEWWLDAPRNYPDWPFTGWGLLEARGDRVYRIAPPHGTHGGGSDLDEQRLVVEAPFLVQVARESQKVARERDTRVQRLESYQSKYSKLLRENADLGQDRDRLREAVRMLGGVDCGACEGSGRVTTERGWIRRCDPCGGTGVGNLYAALEPCSAGCTPGCRRDRPQAHKPHTGPRAGPAQGVEAATEAVRAGASPPQGTENGRSRNGGQTEQ